MVALENLSAMNQNNDYFIISMNMYPFQPRVIIINATESNFDINDFNANEYNLQETLFMISASYNER